MNGAVEVKTKDGKNEGSEGGEMEKDGEVREGAGRRKERDKWGKEKGGRMVD